MSGTNIEKGPTNCEVGSGRPLRKCSKVRVHHGLAKDNVLSAARELAFINSKQAE